MNLGEKLKQLRRLRGVTQKELAGDFLTRNMLSQIERGVAMPSYATIALLSKKAKGRSVLLFRVLFFFGAL